MENISGIIDSREIIKKSLIDIFLIAAVYFVPTFSHLLNFPLYLLDPMRVIIVLSIIFTSRNNSYLLALTLPMFSFILSSHPYFLKAVLITSELTLNIFMFYFLFKTFNNYFMSMLASILSAKVYYYLIKSILISMGLIETNLISTSLLIQLGMALFLSSLIYIIKFQQNMLKVYKKD
jgi:hypothetical protein